MFVINIKQINKKDKKRKRCMFKKKCPCSGCSRADWGGTTSCLALSTCQHMCSSKATNNAANSVSRIRLFCSFWTSNAVENKALPWPSLFRPFCSLFCPKPLLNIASPK